MAEDVRRIYVMICKEKGRKLIKRKNSKAREESVRKESKRRQRRVHSSKKKITAVAKTDAKVKTTTTTAGKDK